MSLADDVFAYVFPHGQTAAEIFTSSLGAAQALAASPGGFDTVIEGTSTAGDLLRAVAAVAAGTTRVAETGDRSLSVEFDAVSGPDVRVTADVRDGARIASNLST